ncbi:uncharacterized protein LOC117316324 [Pecten maximus]|uniref:uncharacterized protein LOC117316324 n=1 Tax=Pecten maximus TaxID=6579 RepID=UPI00145800F3|nr:uncharacterized protein LOC117316324 [Pecten maximus]
MSKQQRQKHPPYLIKMAIEMVTTNQMSLRKASKTYGIAKSTLSDKVNLKTNVTQIYKTALTPAEENRLAEWAVNMAKIGYGRTKNELLETVKKIMDNDGRPNPFSNNKPGKDWYYAFVKRHPELANRTPMQLAKERALITPTKVKYWFRDFKDHMDTEVKDASIFSDPSRWYNADESGFALCPKSGKVIAAKGQPNVYNFTASDKTQITVLAAMSAVGHYVKPMIVFPGQRFGYDPLEGFSDAAFGRSDSGWMDTELFYTWLSDIFLPEVNARGVKSPLYCLSTDIRHTSLWKRATCVRRMALFYTVSSNMLPISCSLATSSFLAP